MATSPYLWARVVRAALAFASYPWGVKRVQMQIARVLGAVALVAIIGCHGAAGGKDVQAPEASEGGSAMVAIGSGVWVVRDYDRAVYFVDGHYWTYRDVWRRSQFYDSGWEVTEADKVPSAIRSQDHTRFVFYHGAADAETRVAARGTEPARESEPPVRASETKPEPVAEAPAAEPEKPVARAPAKKAKKAHKKAAKKTAVIEF